MKRLSAPARRTIETSCIVAAAGLLALISAVPAHATPNSRPSGYTRSATMPALPMLRETTVRAPVHPAATASVSIANDSGAPSGFSFQPASVSIHVGDTVSWTNNSTGGVPHSTTSDSPGWDSGFLNPGQSFSHAFPTAGSFAYHCAVHPSMHGTVVVTAVQGTTTTTSTTRVGGTTTTTAAGSTTTTGNVSSSTTATTAALATTGSQASKLVKIALLTLLAGVVVVAAAGRRRVHD
jgi:plastocyanin